MPGSLEPILAISNTFVRQGIQRAVGLGTDTSTVSGELTSLAAAVR
jgi:hypothetical protein